MKSLSFLIGFFVLDTISGEKFIPKNEGSPGGLSRTNFAIFDGIWTSTNTH